MSDNRARHSARLLVLPLAASLMLAAPSAPSSATESTDPAVAPAATAPASAPATAPAAVAPAVPAAAPTPTASERRIAKKLRIAERGRKILKAARSRVGKPYRYGAVGPNAFDCSGLTSWAFRKIGKKLPRTSGAQAGAVKRVRKPQKGDLVFFTNGRRVYHVGIYAGNHKVLHASRPGTPVRTDRIWTRSVFYGRA